MMQSYLVWHPLPSALCCSFPSRCCQIQRTVVCTGAVSLVYCLCRDVSLEIKNILMSAQGKVLGTTSHSGQIWLTALYKCNLKLCEHMIVQFMVNAIYLWCMSQLETRCWNPGSVKLILQDTQDQSNVWTSMPNHCVWTCWLFLEIEGDTQCDHLLLATEKTSFLLTGGFTEGGEAACFGFASSRGRSSLDPGCGNLEQLTTVSFKCSE